MSRIPTLKNAHGSPEYNMKLLLRNLGPPTIVPNPDKYYVFVYKAKTKGVQYDQHPFIACTSVSKWGFTGMNFHWGSYRRYSWAEVISNIYEINDDELNSMEKYPIAKYKTA